jgi:predicted PurR-regulated permease PerM
MNNTVVEVVLKNALKISVAVLFLGLFVYIMMPFTVPIVLGGILAMALVPVVDYLRARGHSRGRSLLILSASLFLMISIPFGAFIVRGAHIVTSLLHRSDLGGLAQKARQSAYAIINTFSKNYGFDNMTAKAKFDEFLMSTLNFMTNLLSNLAAELPTFFLVAFITVISMYCFLSQAEKIRVLFDRYFYFSTERGSKFVEVVKVSCREVFVSNILTGVLQATVVATGAMLLNVGDFFLVFFLTFVVSFIPIVGAGPVAALLSLVAFVDGRIGSGVGMLVIAGFAGLADNLIRPYLATLGNVEVHPFVSLLAVIGGVIMFGLPGLFIGPLAASLCFGAVPLIIDEYFQMTPAEKLDHTPITVIVPEKEILIEH